MEGLQVRTHHRRKHRQWTGGGPWPTPFNIFIFIAICFFSFLSLSWATENKKALVPRPASGCAACHNDVVSLLGKDHPSVKGASISVCFSCHKPGAYGKEGNKFSAKLHRSHENKQTALDCTACHVWVPGKRFGLPGQKLSYGKPTRDDMVDLRNIFLSWSTSEFTDGIHRKANIDCSGCHGGHLPDSGDSIENSTCLACHGPLEKLAIKSTPEDFPERNPHKSHLGDIGCAVCHKGHSQSTVYCLNCHRGFKMTIPGGIARQE